MGPMSGSVRAVVMVLVIALVLPSAMQALVVASSDGGASATWSDAPVLLYFKAATFDPLTDTPALPDALTSDGPNGQYIVQFRGPVHDFEKEQMVSQGARPFGYIPDYAFMVEVPDIDVWRISSLPFVRAVVPLEPAYKLDQGLWSVTGPVTVRIDVHRDVSLVASEVIYHGGTVDYTWDAGLQAVVSGTDLPYIAAMGPVDWIEQVPTWHISNDVAAGVMNVNTTWNTHGLNGSGQIVAIGDTGLDTGVDDNSMHPDFKGKIVSIIDKWPGAGDGASDVNTGHGTHVAGSVLGNGTKSNGKVKGIAYGAKVYFQALEKNSNKTFATQAPLDTWLFQPAYTAGARVHTNSWGSDIVTANYTAYSGDVDDMIWNNDDMTILFAVGNSGKDTNNDGIVDLKSIDSPATAKNCISVGASENLRKSKGWAYPGSIFQTDPIKSDNAANNPNGMAAFSSRGPTNDSRIKPDLVAPGTGILSTRSSQIPLTETGWGNTSGEADNKYYFFNGGTSMATPLVAGAAAVVREYYVKNWSYATPSAALVKATLINGAYSMPGQYSSPKNDTGPVWDYNQGWGRVNLTNSLFPAPRNNYWEDKLHSLNTGQNSTMDFTVMGTLPLRVTLVWSDYPGTANANPALVNNLDLSLTAPNGTVYKGNKFTNGVSVSGGTFDNRNNVESVYFKTPVVGTWKVHVNATNVPQGPQKYALVITGILSGSPPSSPFLNSPLSGVYTSARPTFNMTTNDVNNDQVQYRIEISKDNFNTILMVYNQSADQSGWTKMNYNSNENALYTVKVGEELSDNVKYYWRAYAWDGTGWSFSSITRNFTVDAKPPTPLTISINSGKNATNTRPVTLTLSSTDSFSGMSGGQSGMDFSNDGLSWSSWESYSTSKVWTLEDFQGLHRVYFRSRDNVGNVADPVSATIIYDNVAPNGLTMAVDNGATYTKDDRTNLSISGSDSTSGVWQMSFSNDGSKWSAWEDFASFRKDWNITDAANGGNANEGKKTIWFKAKDIAGNIAKNISSSIIYDKLPPQGQIMVIEGGNQYTTTRLVNMQVTATDGISGIAFMALDTNGQGFGPWEPYTSSKFIVLSQKDGTKIIKVKLMDGAGNVGANLQGSIIYDGTPPANVTISAVNITNDVHVTVTMNADDAVSGLKEMSFSYDGQLWSAWETWAKSKALTLPVGDGTKDIYLRVRDSAGNIGGPVKAYLVLDTTPPSPTLIVNGGEGYTNSSTVVLTLALPGIIDLTGYGVSLSNDGATWGAIQPLKASMTWMLSSGDGEKKVFAQVSDPAGNAMEVQSGIIVLDMTAPNQLALKIDGGANFTVSSLVHLDIGSNDEFGLAYISFSTDGVVWGPWEPYVPTKDLVLPQGNGERTVHIRIMDHAGNVAMAEAMITLDQIPPEIFYLRINNMSEDSVAYTTTTNAAYQVSAYDEGSNLSEMSFGFNGITWGPWKPYKPKGNLVLPSIQGPVTVYIRVRDHAGNIGNTSATTVILDSQPPEAVSVMLNNGEPTTNQSQMILRVSAVDLTSGLDDYRYKEGDRDWSAWFPFVTSRAIKLTDSAGDKKVYVEVRDRAGNVVPQAMVSITLVKSATLPDLSVSITSVGGGQTVKGTVRISGSVTGGEPTSVKIRIDGGAWQQCDGKSQWSYTWTTTGISDGTHTIEVKASNGEQEFSSGTMALTVKNKQVSTETLGGMSMTALLILIIIAIIVSAIVGAAAAAAMKPKNPPRGPARDYEEPSAARSGRSSTDQDRPREGRKAKGPPSACAYCNYAIEPQEHYVRCAQCGEAYHDDCAHSQEGNCSKCNGPLY